MDNELKHTCLNCGGQNVVVTRNPERVTLPAWHVECADCGPRNVASVEPPISNGIFYA